MISLKKESSLHEKTDSTSAYVSDISVSSSFTGFEVRDFAQALSYLNWNYSGQGDDNFTVAIRQTDDGYEAQMSGSGTAEGGNTMNLSQEAQLQHLQSLYDSLEFKITRMNAELEIIAEENERLRAVEKNSTGFQAGAYLTTGIVVIVLLFLLFLGWRMKVFRW